MHSPRFVKRYAELGPMVTAAATAYAEEVRARRFPGPEHCYGAEFHRQQARKTGGLDATALKQALPAQPGE